MDYSGVALLVVLVIGIVVIKNLSTRKPSDGTHKEKTVYHYSRKEYLMTKSESDFYRVLKESAGLEYDVFAQVHLSSIVDHKVKGQSWKGAFSHINGKSVDFVLCDKPYSRPILAIELDDWSHEKPDRIDRDGIVESILNEAELPLIRIKNWRDMSEEELKQKIATALSSVAKPA
jgi:hypothetical protein